MKISNTEDLPKDMSSINDEAQILWLCDLSDWIMEDGIGCKERATLSIPFINMVNDYPLLVFFRIINRRVAVHFVNQKAFEGTVERMCKLIKVAPELLEKAEERTKEFEVAVE